MLVLSTIREIKETIGRYIALLLIIALGVGFFAGLKVTDPAMRESMHQYFADNAFYDFRLISSLGFENEDIEFLQENIDARAVEPSISFDVIINQEENGYIVKAISIPEKINTIILEEGNMPEGNNECVVDSYVFDSSAIGSTLIISDENDNDDIEHFKYEEYKIVGLVKSPLYIQYERGSTPLGNGVLDGFIYLKQDGFDTDFYTDCYVKLDSDLELYSDEYEDMIDSREDEIDNALNTAATNRYARIIEDATEELTEAENELYTSKLDGESELEEAKDKLDSAKRGLDAAKEQIEEYQKQEKELKTKIDEMLSTIQQMDEARELNPALVDESQYSTIVASYEQACASLYTLQAGIETAQEKYDEGYAEYESGLLEYEDGLAEFEAEITEAEEKIADAKSDIENIEKPDTYLLTRDSNVGYVCFENDSTIVGAIANVFPVFFFLVAALVCMTTMNRMVEDQRTQIGVLKALGYSNASIMAKFIFYSGSAAFVGAAFGFIVGTIAFPKAIWFAYQMMYNTKDVTYYFSPSMLCISFIVAFICSVGVTILSCRYEMSEMAASLMRPKAPRAGKRIFLEYIPFFWNRLKFIKKVSLRNIFRYKGRLFMMVLGIGGCTSLLVAGFGIYDSIADIALNQYSNISLYDMDIMMKDEIEDVSILTDMGYSSEDYLVYYHGTVDLTFGNNTKNIYINVYDDASKLDSFIDMHSESVEHIDLPNDGEVILNHGLCDKYGIKVGDEITISSDSINNTKLKVGAINENFINNYIYMTKSTYEKYTGEAIEYKNIYLNIKENENAHEIGATLLNDSRVTSVEVAEDMLERVDNMMESLNIIVYLVIGCAMALCAVVVYNLTNINISERVREIATVKVLGFYKEETRDYVFRENIILSFMGAAVGLMLGTFLHRFIMSEIVVDLITFDVRINALSYAASFGLTVVFTFVINLFMGKKLDQISMTESLKSID